jgi:hypothetical protein
MATRLVMTAPAAVDMLTIAPMAFEFKCELDGFAKAAGVARARTIFQRMGPWKRPVVPKP